MKAIKIYTLVAFLAAIGFWYGFGYTAQLYGGPLSPYKAKCPGLYPDSSITPGEAATLNVGDLTRRYAGETYSQAHRNVTERTRAIVEAQYDGTLAMSCKKSTDCEVDHFYPLCAGGSNGVRNLWVQPRTNGCGNENFGYREKDKLEVYVCNGVKNGTVNPEVAYKKVTNDWVAYYKELKLEKVAGAINEPVE